MTLGHAHKGYLFQDAFTALFFAHAVVQQAEEIVVDRKEFTEDLFDDLKITRSEVRSCFQFKHSEDIHQRFLVDDIRTHQRDLRIDSLVNCYLADSKRESSTYILITSLLPPDAGQDSFLIRGEEDKFAGGVKYKLNIEQIWPSQGTFSFNLRNPINFTREDFLSFSARFQIVLGCLRPSLDLTNPGPLENNLISNLRDEIGVGVFPNQNKRPIDAAAQLIVLATQARANTGLVSHTNIVHAIQLREDFGYIVQEMPIDDAKLIKRSSTAEEFIAFASGRNVTILVGQPGAGKSWFITNVIEKLRQDSAPAIQHLCFIDPSDIHSRSRINRNVLFGNLIHDLVEQCPWARSPHRPFYAATKEAFASTLKSAAEDVQHFYLFVDGLDHIARIQKQFPEISKLDVAIVEDLISIELPSNVHLVVSSQPIDDLEHFKNGDNTFQIPSWSIQEVDSYIKKRISEAGITVSNQGALSATCFELSEGNPLYLNFIVNRLIEESGKSNEAQALIEMRNNPRLNGNIATYYEHVLKTIEDEGIDLLVAKQLGLVEFPLAANEITTLVSTLVTQVQIDRALHLLAPILVNHEAQGGYQIYHESFRRFIFDRYIEGHLTLRDALEPTVRWLLALDFFQTRKAYLFLFPTLLRAGRKEDILQRISFDFMTSCLFYGHGYKQIDRNLELAIAACNSDADLPKLIVLWELRRALHVCAEERLGDSDTNRKFSDCVGGIHGWSKISDNLMFRGKPAFGARQGILLCTECDENGIVPPWDEYLALETMEHRDEERHFDKEYEVGLFLGYARKNPFILDKVMAFLKKRESIDPIYLQEILFQCGRVFGWDQLLTKLNTTKGVSSARKKSVLLAITRLLRKEKNKVQLRRVLEMFRGFTTNQGSAFSLLLMGADLATHKDPVGNLTDFKIALPGQRDFTEDSELRPWLNLAALFAAKRPDELEAFASTVPTFGWYFGWLRFVCGLLNSAAKNRNSQEVLEREVLEGLKELAKFDSPFEGTPRACDLYSVRDLLREVFIEVLWIFKSNTYWDEAVELLVLIADNTTTELDRAPNGPLTHYLLVDMLLEEVSDKGKLALCADRIRKLQEALVSQGGYYDTQADRMIALAEFELAIGDVERAKKAFSKACELLCGYGHRKDYTIYELIEPLPILASFDSAIGIGLANTVLKILEAVQDNTDGRGTNQVFVSWFRCVCKAWPREALNLLAATALIRDRKHHWQIEKFIEDCIETLKESLPTWMVWGLEMSLRIDNRYSIENDRGQMMLEHLGNLTGPEEALKLPLIAHLLGDANCHLPKWTEDVQRSSGLAYTPSIAPANVSLDTVSRQYTGTPDYKKRPLLFKASAKGTKEWIALLEKSDSTILQEEEGSDGVGNSLGYHLLELIENGKEKQAEELMELMEEKLRFYSRANFWEELAIGMKRNGKNDWALKMYVIGYCTSRGGGGWEIFGGETARSLMTEAIGIDRNLALEEYFIKVKEAVSDNPYGIGLTKNLVEDLVGFGKGELAVQCWEAAHGVIKRRLTQERSTTWPFENGLGEDASLDLDEAGILLCLSRLGHSEERRKSIGVCTFGWAIVNAPQKTIKPLRHFLSRDSSLYDSCLVLRALLTFEIAPYDISRALIDLFREAVKSDALELRFLCKQLLNRIGDFTDYGYEMGQVGDQLAAEPEFEFLRAMDANARLGFLAEELPEFPAEIMFKMVLKQSDEVTIERYRARHKLYSSRLSGRWGAPSYLWYEHEVFDCLLQQMSNVSFGEEIKERVQDPPSDIWRAFDGPDLLAVTQGALGRIPRPNLNLPAERESSEQREPSLWPTGDFVIAGFYEKQIENSSMSGREIPKFSKVYQELILHVGDNALGVRPLLDTWESEAGPIAANPLGVCVLNFAPFNWSNKRTLRLSSWIQRKYGLSQFLGLGPRGYVDGNGLKVVEMVNWSSWFVGSDLAEEGKILEGEALLIKRDLIEKIIADLGRVVSNRSLVNHAGRD